MSIYRKIEARTWSDEKFMSLSPMQPSGQALWFFLLTGPHTGPIPGVFRASRGGMADELGWDLEAFDKAFQEAFDKGMVKADFKAKLVWLPNALKHNKPSSPNVVKSWATEVALLPECELKTEALSHVRGVLADLGTPFLAAFDGLFKASGKAFGKAFENPSFKAMPNQEAGNRKQETVNTSSLRSDDEHAPRKSSKLKSETTIPDDFAISDEVRAWAEGKGFDQLDEHLESFKAKCEAKGYKYANWDAAFRNAIQDDWAGLRRRGAPSGSALRGGAVTQAPARPRKFLTSDDLSTGL